MKLTGISSTKLLRVEIPGPVNFQIPQQCRTWIDGDVEGTIGPNWCNVD